MRFCERFYNLGTSRTQVFDIFLISCIKKGKIPAVCRKMGNLKTGSLLKRIGGLFSKLYGMRTKGGWRGKQENVE